MVQINHQDKWLIICTNISRTGQEGSYCHLERYCHVCRVAESGVNKFKCVLTANVSITAAKVVN